MSRIKECHMLWRADFGLLRYRAYFPLRSRCRAEGVRRIGESTPYYLFHPAAAASAVRLDAAVRAEGRSLKAIAVLRDPAERAWSHYCHGRRLGIESMSFVEALEREDERTRDDPFSHRHHSYRARGLYAEQLARWFAALGRDRVLVLEFGDLLTMDESLRERLRLFLGVDHAFSGRFPGLNAGKGEPMPEDARRLLRRSFEGPDRELAHLLGMRCSWMAPPSPDRPGAT
jgi:hypothetical protein